MNVTEAYLKTYQDLKEHCDLCVGKAVGSNQPAARAMNLRNMGYSFVKYGNKYEQRVFCEDCGKKTPHRRLESADPINEARSRADWSQAFVKRTKKVLNNYDPIERRQLNPAQLEIDHRVPFLKFKQQGSEILDEATITDDEIRNRYMLLSRSNNLLKSRNCERCETSGLRQPSRDGVQFWYAGDETYKGTCTGCYWHDPETWLVHLNSKMAK